MPRFVVTTTSESGDHYIYVIDHTKKPTDKELKAFLKENATDKDDDVVYEQVDTVHEIIESEVLTIPKK